MRPRTRVPQPLRRLAGSQSGVLSRKQAIGGGLSSESVTCLVRRREWIPVARGIYSTRPVGWEQLAWAGLLIAGPGSTLGGWAAAHLIGLAPPPRVIDVWAPSFTNRRVRRAPNPWDFHRGTRAQIGNPPHSSAEETLLDLCSAATPDGISALLGKALSDHKTTPDRLLAALDRAPRLRNRGAVAECLTVVSTGAQSALEARYLKDVERPHGLPAGTRQRSVSDHTVSDVVYEKYRTIAELDGMLGHRGEGEIRDARRDVDHVLLGMVTLRFGWSDVFGRPCEVAAQVAAVLKTFGWQGEPQRCPSCEGIGEYDSSW